MSLLACAAALLLGLPAAQAAPGYAILHTFNAYGDGDNPNSGLVLGTDGNFYGTTLSGGTNNHGTVYRMTPAGVITTIYSFTASPGDGYIPSGELTQDSGGNLYGVTLYGGTYNNGTIYELSESGTAYKILYSFGSSVGDGSVNAQDGVTYSGGYLYGASENGGANNYGTIYKIKADGTGFTTLAALDPSSSGYGIMSPFVISGSTIYGVAPRGGASSGGTLFSLTTSGGSYQALVSFTYSDSSTPGNSPVGLTLAQDGNLYGTTNYGGPDGGGCVFRYFVSNQYISDVHDFSSSSGYGTEGYLPGALTLDPSSGLLYGTTYQGSNYGYGAVYQISTSGAVQVIAPLTYSTLSSSPLAISKGSLYFTIENSGAASDGTVVTVPETAQSTTNTLYDFANAFHDGLLLNGGPIMLGSDGNLHGTTNADEANANAGTAYHISTSGAYTQDYVLPGNAYGGLVQATDGSYVGTTYNGGYYNAGSVYSFYSGDPNSGEDDLDFGQAAGSDATGGLCVGSDGNYYGVTNTGGQRNDGTIFRLTPDGYETVLYSFKNNFDGAGPIGPLVQDASGNLYGVTASSPSTSFCTLFKFSLSNNQLTTLTTSYSSYVSTDADMLIIVGNTLYGVATQGGSNQMGTVFSINTDGSGMTVLHNFAGGTTDGSFPKSGVVLGTDGQLYGATQEGGANNVGVVYSLALNGGSENILHSFNYGGADGFFPESKLVEAPDGNFYGTASGGGVVPAIEYSPNIEGAIYQLQTLLPVVTSQSATSGPPGSSLVLTGVNLGNATTVTFNGVVGTITSDTATKIVVSVPYGSSSGSIVVTTPNGTYTSPSPFTVTVGITAVTLNPTSVVGGQANSTGTISTSAGQGNGETVTLTSSNSAAASVPSSVFVSGGTTSATFTVTSSAVTTPTHVTITAAYDGITQTATLVVNPPGPGLKSVALSPTSTQGGSAATTANRVYLTGNATATTVVSLTSSNTAVATVPSTVTIQSGSSSHVFTIITKAVTSAQIVTITASYNGVTQTATLTVTPPPITLKSVTLSPTSTEGGTGTTANRVYLTGNAAATTTVTLASSNTAVATVPSTVTIQQGSSSHVFTITTKAVTSAQSITITATSGGVSQTATLTVTP